MVAKNNRLTIRLDDVLLSTIKRACENDKCDKTTIVVNALRKGLGIAEESGRRTGSGHRTYYLHNSNPDIKLIDTIRQNGETYYVDTEGRKWLMAPDRTLIAVARLVV